MAPRCVTRPFLVLPKLPLNNFASVSIYRFSTVTKATQLPSIYRKTFSHIFQGCSSQRALDPGKQAHARIIISGFKPTIFVTNCLIQMYIRCCRLDCANKVFDQMSQRDTVSWNAMIFGYSISGKMGVAQASFDMMPEKDVISWNSLISGYLQNGNYLKAVEIFAVMRREDFFYDETTFAVILRACSGLEDNVLGVQVHGIVVKLGFDSDVVTGSAILDMYGKCKRLDESLCFFDQMPERNWVSWSALIAGCVQNDEPVGGIELFKEMQRVGVGVSQSTYASVFRSTAGLAALRLGSQLHGHSLKNNFGVDVIVGTATLDMYAKCNNLDDARKVFNLLPNHNLQSYNALITGYARCDRGFEALQLFLHLLKAGLGFDEISLSGAFSACAVINGFLEGIQVHGLATKTPFQSNVCVGNAILDMYGKCGSLVEARCVFDRMKTRDAVSWNSIIASCEQNKCEEETLLLFTWMLQSRMEPDEFTYGSVLKACAGRQALNSGREIHGRVIKSGMGLDTFVGIVLVDMYCKCSVIEDAEKLHHRMEEQTTVSWNAIMSGFSSHEQSEGAQICFSKMLEMGVKPDNFTFATILDSCANLATVGLGRQIHAQIIKQDLQSDVYINSTLVDMYSKCGNMQDSRLMFDKSPNRDFVTWNAMVCAYANHGLGEEALQIFEKMQIQNVRPNHATFVAVLRACAHICLVERGLFYFNSMQTDYGLDPQLEHYSSMVDILGRSGQVTDALKLIEEMPFEADDVIWRTLLSICRMHGNVEVAEKAASSLLQLDPEDSSAYVLLSNIYADAEMWTEVSNMRKVMRYSRLKKEPGCSWIEVLSEVHMFLAMDKAHPRCREIYENLDILISEMRLAGYVSDSKFMICDIGTEDGQQELHPAYAVSCF
ncbi:pentatricopeptide repeat-containing protein At3g02330, mitochondrial [Olea europaea var. sylvestris]|uniref:pentatricopeptide repeat-containing protein At3g02330, mitochondrial n=1 Tax=Olea europaea var. sylvestris TaxID=158386 RepID=UPI000C1D2A3A|nr:pentatricopeptide repeat-containing protein At3g02330, mitochondrial [Olea europaea var. sylvestris]XP_022844769.1 pentatricopeptide repeat-containing protein At3g02330, mitochondrial [Olea europaea var. sylvestris]XP_022844770.1 pentatricopeptide repeat-containing protein At3g02330, mitochondrial [Olea europaea var. sylvestris]